MRTSMLVSLIAVLGVSPLALAVNPHGQDAHVARQAHSRRHHGRQAETIVEAIARRNDDNAPRALERKPNRIVRRGAGGCRVKGSSFNATTSTVVASSTAVASSTIASVQVASSDAAASSTAAASTTAIANNQYNAGYQQQASTTPAAAASTTTAAAAPATTQASSSSGANSGSLTPRGIKAGVSAGDTLGALGSHIGWWYNWAPTDEGTTSSAGASFVPTLWGGGSADSTDASRLANFKSLFSVPEWIIGMEEPDCATGSGSAGMTIAATAALWNLLMVPKGLAGSLLLSPSMCKQMAEDGWLAQFQKEIVRDFDILNLHINKNSMAGVKADIDYYYNRYNKPIWVTEFACVDDSNGFTPCTDQGQINQFISDIVDLFESDSRVYAYAYSNGYGLGNVWPMWNNGQMTASGQAYLSAISKYH